MSPIDTYAEWQKLCEEFTAARDTHWKAWGVVNQKFMTINQGASQINPTDDELADFENTGQALEDIVRRMDEFVKANV